MRIAKRTITFRKMLEFVNDFEKDCFPLTKFDAWKRAYSGSLNLRSLEYYFPSHIERSVEGLLRKGWVNKIQGKDGLKIIITESGRKQILKYELEKFTPKVGKWDGKWRAVFFDVAEIDRKKRNQLRTVLKNLGMIEFQESVYVGPFDCDKEIKYTREVLDIPHGVKLGILEKIENDDDLRKIFRV